MGSFFELGIMGCSPEENKPIIIFTAQAWALNILSA